MIFVNLVFLPPPFFISLSPLILLLSVFLLFSPIHNNYSFSLNLHIAREIQNDQNCIHDSLIPDFFPFYIFSLLVYPPPLSLSLSISFFLSLPLKYFLNGNTIFYTFFPYLCISLSLSLTHSRSPCLYFSLSILQRFLHGVKIS